MATRKTPGAVNALSPKTAPSAVFITVKVADVVRVSNLCFDTRTTTRNYLVRPIDFGTIALFLMTIR